MKSVTAYMKTACFVTIGLVVFKSFGINSPLTRHSMVLNHRLKGKTVLKTQGDSKTIGLLLVGGHHQILHLVPIASELHTLDGLKVIIFVGNKNDKGLCLEALHKLGMKNPDVRIGSTNRVCNLISPKLTFLLCNLKTWNSLDALITVERTSTILRYLSKKLPPMIHIPHGAGDRAKSYDPRIRHFDNVLVAGEKDKARMMELGLVSDENCKVTGYIKPYAVKQMAYDLPVLFKTKRPTVLYNPHFCRDLSSWEPFGQQLLESFSRTADFNFIFAPHMRLFANASNMLRNHIESYTEFENVHIDLGSHYSTEMTYTRLADIYLGDVSSQVYEFLETPKPCVFIGNRTIEWSDNPDYAHWNYGTVCGSVPDVMTALKRANEDHHLYRHKQESGCLSAKGCPSWNPIKRAAQTVHSILAT